MNEHDWLGASERLSADVDDGCEMLPLAELVRRAGVGAQSLARFCAVGHPTGVRLDAARIGRGWRSTTRAVERFLAAVSAIEAGQLRPVYPPSQNEVRANAAARLGRQLLRKAACGTQEEQKAARFAIQAREQREVVG